MIKSKEWTTEELAELKELAKTKMTYKEIVLSFPNRTARAVEHQCKKYNMRERVQYSKWTKDEIGKLRELYPHINEAREIASEFPNRSLISIKKTAIRLGINRDT